MFSDVLFDGLKGDLDSFSDYWDSFADSLLKTLTDTIAQMAVEWAASNYGMHSVVCQDGR